MYRDQFREIVCGSWGRSARTERLSDGSDQQKSCKTKTNVNKYRNCQNEIYSYFHRRVRVNYYKIIITKIKLIIIVFVLNYFLFGL